MSGMTIAALAREGGVGVETVRYYQRRGLLGTPDRAGPGLGGIRRYGEADVRRLRFIRSAQAAGFTLDRSPSSSTSTPRTTVPGPWNSPRAYRGPRCPYRGIAGGTGARWRAWERACGSGQAGPCPIITAFEHP